VIISLILHNEERARSCSLTNEIKEWRKDGENVVEMGILYTILVEKPDMKKGGHLSELNFYDRIVLKYFWK
jgi:hypothetical protein